MQEAGPGRSGPVDDMTLFRSLFLAGLVLFFAAQQALCACAVPQGADHHTMTMAAAHEVPAGQACEEMVAPDEHDSSTCPHCDTDTQLVLSAAQAVPAPVILQAPALFRPTETFRQATAAPERLLKARDQEHGPPPRTPLQLKTRFLN